MGIDYYLRAFVINHSMRFCETIYLGAFAFNGKVVHIWVFIYIIKMRGFYFPISVVGFFKFQVDFYLFL